MKRLLGFIVGLVLLSTAVVATPAYAADSHKILVGATMVKEDLPYWQSKLSDNKWMRVFPNSDGRLPVASDQRFTYAANVGMRQIFVSSKIRTKWVDAGLGTWSAGMNDVKTKLTALVNSGNFDTVWYTEHHEPEQGSDARTASSYKTDYTMSGGVFATINSLPSSIRSHIKVGHVLTRQWTEKASGGNFNYSLYDTGLGDFFGVDMYQDSFAGSNVITSFTNPDTFLQYIKAYKFNVSDSRKRVFPELGAIGAPFDTNGGSRGDWMRQIHTRVKTWNNVSNAAWNMPWNFEGWIFWNADGKAGGALGGSPGIGTSRYFQLDRRHTGGEAYTVVNPAHALNAWNSMAMEEANPNF